MSQIATFFNPVALPNAAGATAFDANAPAAGESFAATLLDLNALLGVVDQNAQALVDAIPVVDPLATAAVPIVFPQATADATPNVNINAQLSAQFTLLQGIGAEATSPSTPALPQTTAGLAVDKAADPVANIALDLRGSFAGKAETVTPSQQPHAAEVPPAAAKTPAASHATLPVPHLPENRPNANSADPAKPATSAIHATPAGAAKRAAPATPATPAVPAEQSQANAQNSKPIDPTSTSAVPPLTGQSQNSAADGGQQSANGSTQQTSPAATAANAPVLPAMIAAQQFSTALIATPQTAVPINALAVHIARKFEQGSSEFEISLHPADLGKLDITLTVTEDGRVQAALRAERPETLELLQRDARSLEQQLRHAGLDVGSNSLSFSLSNGQNQRQTPTPAWPAFADANDAASTAQDLAISNYLAVHVRDGIDIRV